MSTPFLAEIRLFTFNFAPKGWAQCNGQLLLINQNQALFSILGTTYGGNGTTTFALPNLQGRVPCHFGTGFTLGQAGGEETHTLLTTEMPSHTHLPMASSAAGPDQGSPTSNLWSAQAGNIYAAAPNSLMSPAAISQGGGGQPHENRPPFLVLTFCIALQGIFPSRN
jgi:microcystin-dependent protein